ncbi:hypothetical protein [Stenotrophomonas maltophilia]|uniref:hypothetical protein n=1 Tax=Stenotrophomonas maltophilia TaxID=40324 RepID=UPI0015DE7403|nr:hypothetical protein [Stenotrophomonas maltophilia]MBA0361069.1 hypothetical protein [Stenotrophomonas maltophilia]HEL5042980.1 hypothetical protein [Stenotrophomonas maltophilia]
MGLFSKPQLRTEVLRAADGLVRLMVDTSAEAEPLGTAAAGVQPSDILNDPKGKELADFVQNSLQAGVNNYHRLTVYLPYVHSHWGDEAVDVINELFRRFNGLWVALVFLPGSTGSERDERIKTLLGADDPNGGKLWALNNELVRLMP